MFKRLAHALIILTLLAAIGAHWAVLQSVAWTAMLAENLRSGSLSKAVERTFDGEHPYTLCKSIAKAKQSEKRAKFGPKFQKFEFAFTQSIYKFIAPSHFSEVGSGDDGNNYEKLNEGKTSWSSNEGVSRGHVLAQFNRTLRTVSFQSKH